MHILICDSDELRRWNVVNYVKQIPNVRSSRICADLTSTFNEVEHRPPELVLIAPGFVKLPEFETMEALFRSLKVRWVTYSADLKTNRDHSVLARNNAEQCADFSIHPRKFLETIRFDNSHRKGGKVGASAGLFRSTERMEANQLIFIGSSTGGVDALLNVLGSFPSDCPATIVVQHTGPGFSKGLARLLDRNVEPSVREARDGDVPSPGQVLIAPSSDTHLTLDTTSGLQCLLRSSPKVSGHRPSVDALFRSGVPVAKRVSAAILTGMGRDGAEGLLDLRKAGARTIGQDQATSVVYGMPGSAAQIGAAERSLPLCSIGPALLRPQSKATI